MRRSTHEHLTSAWIFAASWLAACGSQEPGPGAEAGGGPPPFDSAGAGGAPSQPSTPSTSGGSGTNIDGTNIDEDGLSPGNVTVPEPVGTGGAASDTPPVIPPPNEDRCGGGVATGRFMECLDRGVVAVPTGEDTFVSWRLFGTDPSDISFRLYRDSGNGDPALVCTRGADAGTWCTDTDGQAGDSYFVRPVIDGEEQEPSGSAPRLTQDYLRIPLQPASPGAFVHLAWVGDLDGDGEYDFVVDRISGQAPLVDAYSRHGEFLWRFNTGPLGADQNNISGGAGTISNGHNDGVTVFDFDSDGRAEVAIIAANGAVFGDGATLTHTSNLDQFVVILDGVTGRERARAPLPNDFQSFGRPLHCQFGAGYLDGVHPSLITKCKSRQGGAGTGFSMLAAAYDFDGSSLTQRWKFVRGRDGGGQDFHQIRIVDVDGDGRDDLADGGYVIKHDGTLLYSMQSQGVVHGDRFHITDMDPNRPGLEGWGIQQDNPSGLETYYYDAATGEVLRRYSNPNGPGGDMGRGTIASLFQNQPGYEYWSFNGMYSSGSGDLVISGADNVPWPNFAMQWDGDLGSELLDNNQVGDWNLTAQSRNSYSWRRSFAGRVQARGAIPFYGDVLGDWRDEALLESTDGSELRIYTTTFETDVRLYTLVHNPAYRNGLTVHGYRQSNHVDYYLGWGMAPPPQPAIRLVSRP